MPRPPLAFRKSGEYYVEACWDYRVYRDETYHVCDALPGVTLTRSDHSNGNITWDVSSVAQRASIGIGGCIGGINDGCVLEWLHDDGDASFYAVTPSLALRVERRDDDEVALLDVVPLIRTDKKTEEERKKKRRDEEEEKKKNEPPSPDGARAQEEKKKKKQEVEDRRPAWRP
jgi:hypothetical protein